MREPSPYQRSKMQLSLVEYYRRLLICIVNKQAGIIEIEGSELLEVSAGDGLFLKFPSGKVQLQVESADENWEAHTGQPGATEPQAWTVPKREHLEEALQSARATVLDDATVAAVERSQAKRKAVREVIEGEADGGAKSSRLPWYPATAPTPQEAS